MGNKLDFKYINSNTYSNWYKQFPYTFEWRKDDDPSNNIKFNLPIAPQNLQITTHFATNVIPTMYATIEEHSEQRYFDITISGTTGMTPTYHTYYEYGDTFEAFKAPGRSGFAANTFFGKNNALNSFFRKTRELLNKARNEIVEAGSNVNDAIVSGVKDSQTGYVAFHNFYIFLLQYKEAVAAGKKPIKGHPLSFINYKDNNRYDVSITHFSLTRDYRNPMLYNYNITMKAYNLQTANNEIKGDSINLKDFGLNGITTSAFASVSNKVRSAKNAAYAAIAAVKSAGL